MYIASDSSGGWRALLGYSHWPRGNYWLQFRWQRSHFDYLWLRGGMRCQLWKIVFIIEFSGENRAHKNNPLDKQSFFIQAIRMVFQGYFQHVPLPRKVVFKVPSFSPNYLDIKSHDSMFTLTIIKTWDPIHFHQCGWYLDCPSFLEETSFLWHCIEGLYPTFPTIFCYLSSSLTVFHTLQR